MTGVMSPRGGGLAGRPVLKPKPKWARLVEKARDGKKLNGAEKVILTHLAEWMEDGCPVLSPTDILSMTRSELAENVKAIYKVGK